MKGRFFALEVLNYSQIQNWKEDTKSQNNQSRQIEIIKENKDKIIVIIIIIIMNTDA